MQQFKVLFGAIAVVPGVCAIAFGGLGPTGIGPDRALDGFSPKPTKGPSISELRRRQFDDLSVETCGWVNGDFSSAITCNPGRTCMFYSTFGANMAGCCSGSDTQTCGWSNRCVNYKEYNAGACDKDCEDNSFVWKCSDVASPYCVTWTYPSANIVDYGCATYSRSGVFTVFPRGIDLWESFSTTITVSTLSGSAVTGWDITTKKDGETDSATTATADPKETSVPASSSSNSRKTAKKLAIGVIIGIAVAGLFLLFFITVAICWLCKSRKKKSQIAANQQLINAAHASRPQSQHSEAPIALEPHQVPPPLPTHSQSGYYTPQGLQEQKYPESYGYQSPSTPGTPAPQYSQPYYASPPMPEAPGHYPDKGPAPGTHEVDAWSLPRPPTTPGQPATPQPVYELGYGR